MHGVLKPASLRLATVAGGILLLALLIPEADAAFITVDDALISQGESVDLTVTMDAGELFGTSDSVEVTMPNGCVYITAVSVTAATVTYPDDFSASAGNDPLCKANANTLMSGVQNKDDYTASFVPTPGLGVGGDSVTFQALMTTAAAFERGAEVIFTAGGYAPGTPVNFFLDAPTQDNYYSNNSILADGAGWVTARFVMPVGFASGLDIGAWTAHFLESGAPSKATEDRQEISLTATTVVSQWQTQPDNPTPRVSNSGATLAMVYQGSLANTGGPIVMTGQDLESIQYDLTLEYDAGAGFQPLESTTAAYDQATGLWNINYVAAKTQALGTYRFNADADVDRYGNPISVAGTSDPFLVVGTEVQANFTINSAIVERGSDIFPLDLSVKLTYPDGTPLGVDDLVDGESITLGVRRGGVDVPGVSFTANFVSSGTWSVSGQALDPATPTGEIQVFVKNPTEANTDAPDGNYNTVNSSAVSAPINVLATKPEMNLFFFNDQGLPEDSFLRGKSVRFELDAKYSGAGPVTKGHVEDVSGIGISQVRIMPPSTFNADGSVRENTFTLDLEYDSQTATWGTAYTIKGTDPAGQWRVAAIIKDAYNNKNTTEEILNVGLVVNVQASPATGLTRGDSVDLSAQLTRPDGSIITSGTVMYSVLGPGENLVTDQTLVLDAAAQAYKGTFTIPNNALLGTYRIEVIAESTDDRGVGIHEFSLGSNSMQVTELTIGSDAVPRLGSISASFKLAYANGDPVPETVTPVVIVDNGALVASLTPTFADDKWTATYAPGKNAPLGEHRFLISAIDAAGNSIVNFATNTFTVDGAEIVVTNLAPVELRYDRGESIGILANLEYIDGTPVTGASVPVQIVAGTDVVGVVTLTSDGAGKYSGNYTIRLADPLSSESAPWSLRIAENTVVDGDSNIGPAIDASDANNQFSVEPARLGVEFIDTPVGSFNVGEDEVIVKFRLVAVDGTAIDEDVSELKVNLTKGSANVGIATVTRNGDEFTGSYALVKGTLAGTYTFTVSGNDANGNQVSSATTGAFTIDTAASKDTPPMALPLVLVALAAFVIRRR